MSDGVLKRLPTETELRQELAQRRRENNLLRSFIHALRNKAKADVHAALVQAVQENGGANNAR